MPDPVRAGGANPFEYRRPTDQQIVDIQAIRDECRALYEIILGIVPPGRERSLAITKLEEVSMWANKAIVFGPERE